LKQRTFKSKRSGWAWGWIHWVGQGHDFD